MENPSASCHICAQLTFIGSYLENWTVFDIVVNSALFLGKNVRVPAPFYKNIQEKKKIVHYIVN